MRPVLLRFWGCSAAVSAALEKSSPGLVSNPGRQCLP
jgi:hypothetical protein